VIINNNNLHNDFTHLTNVSYELGKQIVNTYNYNLYLLNNKTEIKFSLFILNNSTKIIKSDNHTKMVALGSIFIS